jgi:ureidoglycolate lyase
MVCGGYTYSDSSRTRIVRVIIGGMTSTPTRTIEARPISRKAYEPYGQLIAADDALPWKPANFGKAQRFNYLADVLNLRDSARLNLCIFRCSPFTESELSVKLLEKHPASTQVFMPMQDGRYITIVAQGGERPDLSTLAAFIVEAPQGISYHPGIWHYPMTALGRQLDLACLVFEDESEGDCEIVELDEAVLVRIR